MEMILNEDDIVVGAQFDGGTIQDYVDDKKTYGLIRIENSTANWFLFNKNESDEDIQKLYKEVIKQDHFIHDDFGEEIVIFNKLGSKDFKDFKEKIDEYLNDEMGSIF